MIPRGLPRGGSLGTGVEARVEGSGSHALSDSERKTLSEAKDFVKQNNFQDALSQASQSVRDTKYSDMDDEGQRLAKGVHGSYDTSNTYREEAGKSLQRSKAYSEMASDVHRTSATINSNANQGYNQWLRQQPLPNSNGPMGIKEAEVMMASRPDMERQYQQRFVEAKVASMTSHLQSESGPKSFGDVKEAYDKTAVNNNVFKDSLKQVAQQGEKAGLGKDFKVDKSAQIKATQNLETVGSKMKAGEASLKSGGDALAKGVQDKVGNHEVTAPSMSGGGEGLLKLGGGGTSGLSNKIKNIEDQMSDQTEAMERANKMQAFAKSKNLGK